MNYQEFLKYKLSVERQGQLRLDCMNLPTSMEGVELLPASVNASLSVGAAAPIPAEEALLAWNEIFKLDTKSIALHPFTGIRAALKALFESLSGQDYTLVLPTDVYPVYWELAKTCGLDCLGLPTYPTPGFNALPSLNRSKVCLLLPHPLAPTGRYLSDDECKELETWLNAPEHLLLLDAVYEFRRGFHPKTTRLIETGKCIAIHSLSKAWLAPGVLGVVAQPRSIQLEVKSTINSISITASELLTNFPHLPEKLSEKFRDNWMLLRERLKLNATDWMVPETGYLSVYPAAFEDLLQNNWLGVPASVFGSSSRDSCIISCLHDFTKVEELL